MRKCVTLVFGTVLAVLIAVQVSSVQAQQTYTWGPGSPYNQMYDPANETTAEGDRLYRRAVLGGR
jgi:hypothetical protein